MTEETVKKTRDKGTLMVGSDKPFMNYVNSAMLQLRTNDSELKILARGKNLSRAVDITQILRNRFLKDELDLIKIDIGSEKFINKDKKEVTVSSIEIILKKKQIQKKE